MADLGRAADRRRLILTGLVQDERMLLQRQS